MPLCAAGPATARRAGRRARMGGPSLDDLARERTLTFEIFAVAPQIIARLIQQWSRAAGSFNDAAGLMILSRTSGYTPLGFGQGAASQRVRSCMASECYASQAVPVFRPSQARAPFRITASSCCAYRRRWVRSAVDRGSTRFGAARQARPAESGQHQCCNQKSVRSVRGGKSH